MGASSTLIHGGLGVLCFPYFHRLMYLYPTPTYYIAGGGLALEVAQRRVRLLLGWVTVCRQVNHLGI